MDNEEINSGERRKAVFLDCDRVEPYSSYVRRLKPDVFQSKLEGRETVESLPDNIVAEAPHLDTDALRSLLEDPQVLVGDVRGNFAYSTEHIPGSVNILDELFSQIVEQGNAFPRERKIVVKCYVGTILESRSVFQAGGKGYAEYSGNCLTESRL